MLCHTPDSKTALPRFRMGSLARPCARRDAILLCIPQGSYRGVDLLVSESHSRKCLIPALLLISVGIGWLLTTSGVIPGVNWVWVLGLAVVGFLVLFIGGIDKVTAIVGPFLMISTIFSLLRQSGHLSADTEVPCLLIVAGTLALIVYFLPLSAPDWLENPQPPGKSSSPGQAQTAMVGRTGVVTTPLNPPGTVSVDGAVYAAMTRSPPVSEGTKVRVDGYDRSFLVVEEIEVTAPGPS